MHGNNNNGLYRLWELLNEYSILVVLVAAGSITHVLVAIKQAHERGGVLPLIDLVASFCISMFAGMVFVMAAQSIGAEGIQLGLAGSLGAFLGVNGLNWLTDQLMEKLTQKKGN